MPSVRLLAAVAAFCFLLPPGARAFDVTTCGQIVPPGEVGVLGNDLFCASPTNGCYGCAPSNRCFPTGASCTVDADCANDGRCAALPAVALGAKSTLDMQGHTIVAPDQVAVACRSRTSCTVTSTTGRGDISGCQVGIIMVSGKLAASHIDVHDNVGAGIYTPLLAVKMKLTDVSANGNGGQGIRAKDIRADGVTANGNHQAGIEVAGKFLGANVTTNDNAWAGTVTSRLAQLTGFTATGNGNGSDLGGAGLIAGAAKLDGATITGNTFTVDDGGGGTTAIALDLLTQRRPKVSATACDHSASFNGRTGVLGPPWGVCAGD